MLKMRDDQGRAALDDLQERPESPHKIDGGDGRNIELGGRGTTRSRREWAITIRSMRARVLVYETFCANWLPTWVAWQAWGRGYGCGRFTSRWPWLWAGVCLLMVTFARVRGSHGPD